jgi:hypothetical protein
MALAATPACATVGDSFDRYGFQRAVFDLQCPGEQLHVQGLNFALTEAFTVGAQVGVEGCGRRAVYVATQSGWLANSPTTDAIAAAAAPAPSVSPPSPPH